MVWFLVMVNSQHLEVLGTLFVVHSGISRKEATRMPRFKKLDPSDVVVGRGPAKISREPYFKAIQSGEAGAIELDDSDRPGTVKRLLREAARDLGVKVRSSWSDDTQRLLVWKKSPEVRKVARTRR